MSAQAVVMPGRYRGVDLRPGEWLGQRQRTLEEEVDLVTFAPAGQLTAPLAFEEEEWPAVDPVWPIRFDIRVDSTLFQNSFGVCTGCVVDEDRHASSIHHTKVETYRALAQPLFDSKLIKAADA